MTLSLSLNAKYAEHAAAVLVASTETKLRRRLLWFTAELEFLVKQASEEASMKTEGLPYHDSGSIWQFKFDRNRNQTKSLAKLGAVV